MTEVRPRRAVVAIGGNAIDPSGGTGGAGLLEKTLQGIAGLVVGGWEVVVVHGNGPQVGSLLLAHEAAGTPMPLDGAVAATQGTLGYAIQRLLGNALAARGVSRGVATIVTQVEVDAAEAALAPPTKPVGPEYLGERVAGLEAQGWALREVHPGRWRRLVPSPRPQRVVEMSGLRALLSRRVVPVVAGGGGVPVGWTPGGRVGVEAVIDKDHAAALIATGLRAAALVIVTNVDCVYLDYESPQRTPLMRLTVAEAQEHASVGHFAPGSMGPKVQACVDYVRRTGGLAAIGPVPEVEATALGTRGTVIVP
jgi:carbamate kinase